ncbi:MAG: cell envelope integrity protein TolA [Pseudomonadota bacterium]
MLRGLPASLLIHGALIFGGAVVWPVAIQRFDEEPVIVPIDLVTVASTTDIAPIVDPKDSEDPPDDDNTPPPLEELIEDLETFPDESVDSEDAFAPPPDEGAEATLDNAGDPPPVDESETNDDLDDTTEDQTPPADAGQTTPPVDNFDDLLSDTSGIFDRTSTSSPNKTAPPPAPPTDLEDRPDEPRRGAGARQRNQARIEAIVKSQMIPCWSPPTDAPDPLRLQVVVEFALQRDGNLAGNLRVVTPSERARIGDPFMEAAVGEALTAVRKCAPYRLPQDEYDIWKSVTVNVGLKELPG